MFLNDEGASKVLSRIGVLVSNDIIQRLYDRIELINNPNVEVLWGMIPTCEGMELAEITEDTEKWDIIKRGVNFYKANREFLLYGTYEAYLDNPECRKDIKFKDKIITCPGVIGSVYTYQDNTYVLAYNYTDCSQELAVRGRNITVQPKAFTLEFLLP